MTWASVQSPCFTSPRLGGLPNSGINTSINNNFNFLQSPTSMHQPGGYTGYYGVPSVTNNHQKQKLLGGFNNFKNHRRTKGECCHQ